MEKENNKIVTKPDLRGMQQLEWCMYVCCVGPLDRHAGSFKCRSLDRSQKVATWLIDSQGAQAWNKGLFCFPGPNLENF